MCCVGCNAISPQSNRIALLPIVVNKMNAFSYFVVVIVIIIIIISPIPAKQFVELLSVLIFGSSAFDHPSIVYRNIIDRIITQSVSVRETVTKQNRMETE